MTILALDPSLSSTGYAYRENGELYTGVIETRKMRGSERLDYILKIVSGLVSALAPSLVAYEGYAMGVRGGRTFDMGEQGGVLKHYLWKEGVDALLIPPTSMKMFVAGSGNADKPKVAGFILAELGYALPSEDESDAVGLLMVGEAFAAGLHLENASTNRRNEALAGCKLLEARRPRFRKIIACGY